MALDRLTTIPIAITSGTNLRLTLTFNGILASDGGSIVMHMRGIGEIPESDISYGTDGDAYTIDVLPAASSLWTPAFYQYTIIHTDTDGVSDLLTSGRLEVIADPVNESKKDARTNNEIFLSRLYETAKEIAMNQYKTIQLGDMIYSGQNLPDLHKLIVEYENRVIGDNLAEQSKQGKNTQFDVTYQFTD